MNQVQPLRWNDAELGMLRRHRSKPIWFIAAKIPTRSPHAIECKLSRLYPEGGDLEIPRPLYQKMKFCFLDILREQATVTNCYEAISYAVVKGEVTQMGTSQEEPWALVDGSLDEHLKVIDVSVEWFTETVQPLLLQRHINKIRNLIGEDYATG